MSERVSNILELPHEILVSIILYLNARERLSLSRACQKFNTLVFEDAELLRDLDFSQNAHLTTLTHIREYLENKNTHKYLRRLNVSDVECIGTYLFHGSPVKALNLVDINMHGITFDSISQLEKFLNSQQHLKRLSFNWPKNSSSSLCCKVLQGPFSRLRYLSVELRSPDHVEVFMPCLLLCEKLQELRVVENLSLLGLLRGIIHTWNEYYGDRAEQVKQDFVPILEDPQQWAALQFGRSRLTNGGFYLENIKGCGELQDSNWIEYLTRSAPKNQSKFGFDLSPTLLLTAALRFTRLYLPEKFCCSSTFREVKLCLLNIEDAKRMMKNPRYPISRLDIEYNVGKECVVHLIASAFPNLTKLVLSKRV